MVLYVPGVGCWISAFCFPCVLQKTFPLSTPHFGLRPCNMQTTLRPKGISPRVPITSDKEQRDQEVIFYGTVPTTVWYRYRTGTRYRYRYRTVYQVPLRPRSYCLLLTPNSQPHFSQHNKSFLLFADLLQKRIFFHSTTTMQESEKPVSLERKISISEAVEGDGSGHTNAPSWISWLEIPFQVADPATGRKLPEVTGWAMDSAGRGPLNLVGSYVGTAILRLAIKEAGGPDNPIKWGLKPSSLLTLMSSVIGVIAALLMPITGAMVDHTPHRRILGIVSGIFAVGLIGVQASISVERNNWFFILVIDTLQSFSLLVHYCAALAYLPDLTTDQEVLSHYTSRFNFKQYIVHFTFVALVVIMTKSRGNYNKVSLEATVQTSRDATLWAFSLGCIFIGYSWTFLFRQRPALSKVPEGSNLITCGFVQLRRTASTITSKYHALRVFMFSMLWSPDAGAGVVLSITVTFLTIDMQFSAVEIAKASLILMASTAMGSLVSKVFNQLVNPLNSYRLGLSWLGIFFGVSIFVFTGPERKESVYGFASLWGIGLGWTYPSQRVIQCSLIPKGQETEMMGLFTFVNQVLGWAPALIVTLLNENDIDRIWSIMVLCAFCLFSVFCTFFMGDYAEACSLVERDSEEKRQEMVGAASQVVRRTGGDSRHPENADIEERLDDSDKGGES